MKLQIRDILKTKNIIYLNDQINIENLKFFTGKLIYFKKNKTKGIINIYHGKTNNKFAISDNKIDVVTSIYDLMNIYGNQIHTTCLGIAEDEFGLIMSFGKKKSRYSLINSTFYFNNLSMYYKYDNALSLGLYKSEIQKQFFVMLNILSSQTSKPVVYLWEYYSYPKFLSSIEAKELGIIDTIIG
uniref:Chloroplast ATP-dependent Clp protease proteolytic subunit 4 n=1 Tax=Gymnochlora stellata TaxID=67809 RepID=B5A4F4_GYMST|nr:chloroplast ATP-dependent Clp protease proteolytic subunit 4 [Gymnochlora stellata]